MSERTNNFLSAAKSAGCISYQIHKTLYTRSPKKNRENIISDSNHIFPPSLVGALLTKYLSKVLECECDICTACNSELLETDIQHSVKTVLESASLKTNIVVLISMGAGFSIRTFIENGLLTDKNFDVQNYMGPSAKHLFESLQTGISELRKIDLSKFKDIPEMQLNFVSVYVETAKLFNTEIMGREMMTTIPEDANLPFILERPFDNRNTALSHITVLQIHSEYLAVDESIKVRRSFLKRR